MTADQGHLDASYTTAIREESKDCPVRPVQRRTDDVDTGNKNEAVGSKARY